MTTTVKSKQNIDLIWKHKSSDFKGTNNGVKTVVYPAPYGCLGSIEGMPDELFEEELRWALHKEKCLQCDKALKPIMAEFGLLTHFEATEQWRRTLDDVLQYASFAIDGPKFESLKERLVSANLQFPGEYKH